MGCLKLIIQIIILFFAAIGVFTVMKFDYQGAFEEFRNPSREAMLKAADDFGDFSKLDSDYKIQKPIKAFGYQKLVIEHSPSSQAVAFLKIKDSEIKVEDFQNKKIDALAQSFLGDFDNFYLGMKNFKITGHSSVISGKKQIPYITFQAEGKNLPIGQIAGILGAYELNDETKFFISTRKSDKFSKKIVFDLLQATKFNDKKPEKKN